MQNSDHEWQNFLFAPNTHVWVFFLHTFLFLAYLSIYFKSNIYYHTQWFWRKTFWNLTLLWRRNNVNLMTTLCDVLYDQCKLNTREKFLFGVRWHGWDKNFYPKRKPRISLSSMQAFNLWNANGSSLIRWKWTHPINKEGRFHWEYMGSLTITDNRL